jgi:PiT family inorganic phosphate transporter
MIHLPFLADPVTWDNALFLLLALAIALGFEFVNGFHDTANAVATVIYTRALRPGVAVAWSGLCNFAGVWMGGIAVAYAIVNLLPVELLLEENLASGTGKAMVLALLLSAIIWNLATWYMGIPASSSHALIGSVLGVGIAHSCMAHNGALGGINWEKAQEVGLSLLLSPAVGFCLSAGLMVLALRLLPGSKVHSAPHGQTPPPFWTRLTLIGTCTGVSLAHGSNDGQKGVGLIMLILIGTATSDFAVNMNASAANIDLVRQGAEKARRIISRHHVDDPDPDFEAERARVLVGIDTVLALVHKPGGEGVIERFAEIPSDRRKELRNSIIVLETALHALLDSDELLLTARDKVLLKKARSEIRNILEYSPAWVIVAVALALGVGTTVGWKRIVVTVGEKIGKTHLTYAQGAVAEVVAASTIGMAVVGGAPVSTTHVLSSGVAGTMATTGAGVQMATIRSILLAWVLTLPACMLCAGLIFATLGTLVR